MNKRQERALEVFLFVTFAIAMVVGVGNTKSDTNFLSTSFQNAMGDSVIDYGQALSGDDSHEDTQLQSMISFARSDAKINALGRIELLKHAKVLRSNPHLILNIVGHAQSSESAGYTQPISEQRATHVYELLVFYGTPKEQLIVDSYDESSPAHDGAVVEENRCVELQYLSTLTASALR
jgi:outer membrane protein OmpA-like peptidoglycan-associated protein